MKKTRERERVREKKREREKERDACSSAHLEVFIKVTKFSWPVLDEALL